MEANQNSTRHTSAPTCGSPLVYDAHSARPGSHDAKPRPGRQMLARRSPPPARRSYRNTVQPGRRIGRPATGTQAGARELGEDPHQRGQTPPPISPSLAQHQQNHACRCSGVRHDGRPRFCGDGRRVLTTDPAPDHPPDRDQVDVARLQRAVSSGCCPFKWLQVLVDG